MTRATLLPGNGARLGAGRNAIARYAGAHRFMFISVRAMVSHATIAVRRNEMAWSAMACAERY
jgi:hypothetical protein